MEALPRRYSRFTSACFLVLRGNQPYLPGRVAAHSGPLPGTGHVAPSIPPGRGWPVLVSGLLGTYRLFPVVSGPRAESVLIPARYRSRPITGLGDDVDGDAALAA